MTRRIGFGGDGPEMRKQRRARADRQSEMEAPAQGRRRPAPPDRQHRDKSGMGLGARLFTGGFLIIWLIGWSIGILFAFAMLFEGPGGAPSLFLVIWLSAAALGWVFAVLMLIRVIRGKPFRTRTSRPFLGRQVDPNQTPD